MAQGARKTKGWLSFVPFLVLAFFFVAAFVYQAGLDARASVGAEAPDFTLARLDGGEAALSEFRGRPVVINFWTTWCKECRDEVPDLDAVYRAYAGEVVILGVSMREPESVVRPFVERYQATYPVLLDRDRRVAKMYRVTGVPETWVVGPDGVLLRQIIGPVNARELERTLVELALVPEREVLNF